MSVIDELMKFPKYDFTNSEKKLETWYEVDVFLEHAFWHLRNVKAETGYGEIIFQAREEVKVSYKVYGITANPYDSLREEAA